MNSSTTDPDENAQDPVAGSEKKSREFLPRATRRKLSVAILITLAALILLPGLGRRRLVREVESRIALTAREMANGGSWLIPMYRGELRLKKPPVPYWLVAGLYKAGAPVNNPFWARLPTALLGIGLAVTTCFAGAVMAGWRLDFFAGLALITTQPFFLQSRRASADTGMILFIVLSMGCIMAAIHRRGHGAWWLAAGACAGFGFLMKGVAAVAIPICAVALLLVLRRDILGRGRWRWAMGGLLLCALIAAPWYLYIYQVTHGAGAAAEAVSAQLEETFGTVGRHSEPFWYYLENWLGTMAPWGWLAPFALWCVWKRRRHEGLAFLFSWFAVSLVLLSVITTKQRHYAFILLPPTAIAVGLFLSLLKARRGFPSDKAMVITSTCLALATAVWLAIWQPNHEDEGILPGFMKEATQLTADRSEIWTCGEIPWSTEFYFDRPVQALKSPTKAWRKVPAGGAMIALEYRRPLKGLDEVDGTIVLDQARGKLRCVLFLKDSDSP